MTTLAPHACSLSLTWHVQLPSILGLDIAGYSDINAARAGLHLRDIGIERLVVFEVPQVYAKLGRVGVHRRPCYGVRVALEEDIAGIGVGELHGCHEGDRVA